MRAVILFLLVAAFAAGCGAERPAVTLHAADTPPARLSDWGVVFANGRQFEINEGVVPYSLNTPLFSDYALKLRTVWLPENTAATYRDAGPMEFPVGTIVSKTFHYEMAAGYGADNARVVRSDHESALDSSGRLQLDTHLLIETRLLVRYEDGWRALPYVWNDEQTEAFLEVAGDIRSLTLVDADETETFVYVVPDANQCAGCHATDHTSGALQLIGPTAWQLNRTYTYGAETANQVDRWQQLGILSDVSANVPPGTSWLSPGDATVAERAKAYLDVNCAHCHNSEGAADTSGLDLAIDTPVSRSYGVCKPPVAVGRGSGDRPYDIFPGQPDESIMIFRMENTDPAIAMPELGRGTVHREAMALLRDWVSSLPGDC